MHDIAARMPGRRIKAIHKYHALKSTYNSASRCKTVVCVDYPRAWRPLLAAEWEWEIQMTIRILKRAWRERRRDHGGAGRRRRPWPTAPSTSVRSRSRWAASWPRKASIARATKTADIGTSFSGIPFTSTPNAHTSEPRFTARQSRLTVLAQGDVEFRHPPDLLERDGLSGRRADRPTPTKAIPTTCASATCTPPSTGTRWASSPGRPELVAG